MQASEINEIIFSSAPPGHPRPELEALRKALDREPVVHVFGSRQTGKTALLRGVAAALAREAEGVLFAPARRPSVREHGLEVWIESRLGPGRLPRTLVVDDVHVLADWRDQVERLGRQGVRLLLGGQHGPVENAAGVGLHPLPFREWVARRHRGALRGLPSPIAALDLLGPPPELRDHLWQVRRQSCSRALPWNRYLREFTQRGGYPALLGGHASVDDYLLHDVVETALGIDVPERAPIEQPDLLRKLLLTLARRTGEEVSQGELARELFAAQPVVGRYLGHLVDAGLVREIRRYPASTGARVPSKYALVDPGLRGAVTSTAYSPWESEPIAATLLQTALRDGVELGFWRDYERPGDRRSPVQHVSLVARARQARDRVLPLQIDLGSDPEGERERALRAFLRRFGCPGGILVTRDFFRIDPQDQVVVVPLSELMIALGQGRADHFD